MRFFLAVFCAVLFAAVFPAQAPEVSGSHNRGALKVVSTTGIINDIALNIGGDRVVARSLMGPGVDPHLYRATAGDIKILSGADLIFHHGLHLEGKISDVMRGIKSRGIKTVAVTDGIPRARLISKGGDSYDPHVWFDPFLWSYAAKTVAEALSKADPENADFYRKNARAYIKTLSELDDYARRMSAAVAEDKRILVTSHDAFGYFARAYGFKVTALQGVSTASEAAVSDVRNAVATIIEKRLPAIFTETSVSPRYIEAVKEAVESSGKTVSVGGKLYSDALGSAGSGQETFYGMFRHNVDVICISLSGGMARKIAGVGGKTGAPQSRF